MERIRSRRRPASSSNWRLGPQARAHWVFNGTAANVLALKTLLEPWHAVICAKSSHLNLDECAAPEAVGGIKLIPVESPDGKLSPHQIREEIVRRGDQHFAQPYVVSITQPTEWGTLYSLEELEELKDLCQELKLKLHIDGARFSVAAAKLNVDLRQLLGPVVRLPFLLGVLKMDFSAQKQSSSSISHSRRDFAI